MKTKPGPGAPQVSMSPGLITKVREDTEERKPTRLGMDPVIYALLHRQY